MVLVFHLVVFAACISWFHYLVGKPGNNLLLPVIMGYLASTIVCFILYLALQTDYPDGWGALFSSALLMMLFWLWTLVVLLIKYIRKRTLKHLFLDLAQTSVLLLFPFVIFLLIGSRSFKMGG